MTRAWVRGESSFFVIGWDFSRAFSRLPPALGGIFHSYFPIRTRMLTPQMLKREKAALLRINSLKLKQRKLRKSHGKDHYLVSFLRGQIAELEEEEERIANVLQERVERRRYRSQRGLVPPILDTRYSEYPVDYCQHCGTLERNSDHERFHPSSATTTFLRECLHSPKRKHEMELRGRRDTLAWLTGSINHRPFEDHADIYQRKYKILQHLRHMGHCSMTGPYIVDNMWGLKFLMESKTDEPPPEFNDYDHHLWRALRKRGRLYRRSEIEDILRGQHNLTSKFPKFEAKLLSYHRSEKILHGYFLLGGSFCDYLLGRFKTFDSIDVWSTELDGLPFAVDNFDSKCGSEHNYLYPDVDGSSYIYTCNSENVPWLKGFVFPLMDKLDAYTLTRLNPCIISRGFMEYVEYWDRYILFEADVCLKPTANPSLSDQRLKGRYPWKHENNLKSGAHHPTSLFDLAFQAIRINHRNLAGCYIKKCPPDVFGLKQRGVLSDFSIYRY